METTHRLGTLRFAPPAIHLVCALVARAPAAQFTVTNTNDSGAGSFRQELLNAGDNPGHDTVDFDLGPGQHVITATSGEILTFSNTTICGPAELANRVSISGNNSSRVLKIGGGTIVKNLTILDGGAGGIGITSGDDIRLEQCYVRDNNGAAGCLISNATVVVENCTFAGNTSGTGGGGLQILDSNVTLVNATISGNTAEDGGGIALFSGTLNLINSTVVENVSNRPFGGGLYHAGGTFVVQNTIVAGNEASGIGEAPDLTTRTAFTNLGNNLIGNNLNSVVPTTGGANVFFDGVAGCKVGTNSSPIDPLLGPRQNNGGLAPTHLPFFGSPVVDAGHTGAVTNPPFSPPPFVDGRLGARVVGASVDIGAVELLDIDGIFTVTNTNNSGTGSLRSALEAASGAGTGWVSFDPAVFGSSPQTITLTGGQIVITGHINIVAPFNSRVTIDGANNSRIFDIISSGTGKVTLRNFRFRNGSRTNGAAIRVIGADTEVCGDDLVFEDNEANSSTGAGGGALTIHDATVTLTDSAFVGNHSEADGGAIALQNNADLALTNVTVSGNTADGSGGGIANNGGELVLTNVTITDNTAAASNTLIGAGGGVSGGPGATVQAWNTIIAGNHSNNADPDISGSGFSSLGHNLIGEAIGGAGFTNGVNNDQVGFAGSPLDPMLDPIADNGGDTLTHHLQTGGPAVNAGDNAALTFPPFDDPNRDQRGQFRVFNNNVDIGAYERTLVTVVKIQGNDRTIAEDIPGTGLLVFERAPHLPTARRRSLPARHPRKQKRAFLRLRSRRPGQRHRVHHWQRPPRAGQHWTDLLLSRGLEPRDELPPSQRDRSHHRRRRALH